MENRHVLESALAGDLLTSDSGFRQLAILADEFGGRAAGSPQESATAAYLTKTLLDLAGVPPVVSQFRYQGWCRGEADVAVTSPLERELLAVALPGSPSGDVEAELISVGAGEEEDFAAAGAAVKQKVVLCAAEGAGPRGRPSSHRRAKYRRAVGAGAVGFLYAGQNAGMLPVTGGLSGTVTAPIPGFGVAHETAAFLERLLARGTVTVRLHGRHGHEVVTSGNIVIDLPGKTAETFLIGAHYDGHDIGQGATDNGSGTAVLLELVRALVPWRGRLQRTIRCCFWGSEEAGLLGSWHYSRSAGATLDPVSWVLNLDSVVNGPPGPLRLRVWPPSAADAVIPVLQQPSLATELRVELTADSDHFPFAAAGIPVVSVSAGGTRSGLVGRGWGHTVADTVDKVDPAALAFAASTAGRVLVRLSEADFQAERLTGQALEEALTAAGHLEASRRWQDLNFV